MDTEKNYKDYLTRYEFLSGNGTPPTFKPLTKEQFEQAEKEWRDDYDAAWDREDFSRIRDLERRLAV